MQRDFSRLDELTKTLAQRAYCEKKKKILLETLNDLTQQDLRLSAQLAKETNDYEVLERTSLKKLIAMLSKDFEAKKDKEYQEMKIAAFKRESLREELEQTRAELENVYAELEKMAYVQQEYDVLLKEKLNWATENHSEVLAKFESEIFVLKKRIKETMEAKGALNALNLSLKSAEEGLSSAKGWGVYDIIAGGMLSSMVKHDHIDRASAYLKDASHGATVLMKELKDIDVSLNVDVIEIDQFSRTFDIFFDNIFSDLTVQDEVEKAYKDVISYMEKAHALSTKLNDLLEKTKAELDAVVEKRDAFVCGL